MLFILHPGNISTAEAAAASSRPSSLIGGYEPQPVPQWTNATQVNNSRQHLIERATEAYRKHIAHKTV